MLNVTCLMSSVFLLSPGRAQLLVLCLIVCFGRRCCTDQPWLSHTPMLCHTVDRQMRRYSVPRIVFVNKLDRVGANPWRVIQQARDKLKLNAAAVQVGSKSVGCVGWHMV